jgi:hypothetical protein
VLVSSLTDAIDDAADEASIATLRRERDAARQRAKRLEIDLADALERAGLIESLFSATPAPPKWMAPKRSKKDHRATACAILSDTHFDEVVRPAEVHNLNAYDRSIAEMRLRRWTDGMVSQTRDYLSGVTFDGACVMLGGDIFSGTIHEELAQTNEDTMVGSVLHWSEQLCSSLTVLAEHFGKIHVPVVVGNHGRLTRKPRSKLRARDNYDYLVGGMIARHFRDTPEVTVQLSEAADLEFPIYSTRYLLTHGDQVTGGGGIGGIWPPIMRMVARKRARADFDTVVMGHWHQLIMAPTTGLIVNGSLKGVDEYAFTNNFAPERAQQAMWITTPEHGVTWSAPIFCDDRAAEGW